MYTILKKCKISTVLFYALIVPLAAIASTAFAMSLQPVIDQGMSGDTTAFARASAWAILCVILDNLASYLENVQRVKLVNNAARQLRFRYFNYFFKQPVWKFAGKDSSYYLTKLTTEAETVAAKYCEGLLRI